jgi:hypothetical protein
MMNMLEHRFAAAAAATAIMTFTTLCSGGETHTPMRQKSSPPLAPKQKVFLQGIQSVAVETLRPNQAGIERTPSGVATKVIKHGTGKRHPTSDDGVVLYSQIYDATGHVKARWDGFVGDPAKEQTREGWEILRMMVEGEVRRAWLPDPKSPDSVAVDYELTWITPRPTEEVQTSAKRK